FSLKVSQSLCNPSGTLHGGAVALIYDVCTSMALELCSEDGFWDTGHVSRTLNCTYLRPAREGATLTVESEVVNLGRRMAMLKGVMRGEDGKICSTCEHGKVAVGGAGL
ncbi:HotDog domain-containing protein, partial [Massariosphaeria phaeospora]